MTRQNHNKRGFNLTRSHSEAIAHKTRMGFNLIEAAFVLAVVGAVIERFGLLLLSFMKITRSIRRLMMWRLL